VSIESSQVIDIQQRKHGGLRVRLSYQLTGGRDITIGPISVADIAAATGALASREPSVLQSIQQRDAEDAVALGQTVANKEASAKQVYRAWILKGLNEPESWISYTIIKKVIQKVQDLGLTVAQAAIQLELDEDQVQRLLDRWQYLNANKVVIDAYKIVAEGDI
jgi:hypothetical protein